MSRSSWKPKFIHNEVATQFMNRKQNTNEEIVAFNRATYLTEPFIGQKIHVYNGLRFYSIVVSSEMLGHRLGEFAPTRKKPVAKKDKKKVVKKK
jgi:small subunit ribosomal protein S19